MKKILSILLLLLVSVSLFAVELNMDWTWETNDEEVKFFRFQLNGEDESLWTVVDSSVTTYSENGLDGTKTNTFYLQQSYDGNNWSESATYESDKIVPSAIEEFDSIDIRESQFKYDEKQTFNLEDNLKTNGLEIDIVVETEVVEIEEVVVSVVDSNFKQESNFNLALSFYDGFEVDVLDFTKKNPFVFEEYALNFKIGLGFENLFSHYGFKINANAEVPFINDMNYYKELDNYHLSIDLIFAMFTFNSGKNVFNLGIGIPLIDMPKFGPEINRPLGYLVEFGYRYNFTKVLGLGFDLTAEALVNESLKSQAHLGFIINI